MDSIAPEGQIWVCGACGKTAKDQYGPPNAHFQWDVSCVLNSILVYEDYLEYDGKLVMNVKKGGIVK